KRARRARWRGQWRDAKGFRFSLLDGERIVHVLSWHQVQNEAQLGAALKQVKEAGVIPEEQGALWAACVGAGGDGARVCGNMSRPCFPTRVRGSIITTVPSISIGSPKPTMAPRCRP